MNAFKSLALLAWAAFALVPEVAARLAALEGIGPLAAYLVLLLATLGGLVAAMLVRQPFVRWCLAVVTAATAMVGTGFARATGEFLTYDSFINLVQSRSFAGDALAQFGGSLTVSLALSALLLLAIGLPPRGQFARPARLAVVPLAVVGLVTAILFVRGGDGGRGIPASYPTLAYFLLYAGESAASTQGERDASRFALASEPQGHLVLVIDESISGQYLDINSPHGVRTPLSQEQPGVKIINYGVVPSITNCSYGTNIALRFGGTRENYREVIAQGPSVWEFARRAGMRTVYIDTQRTEGARQNGMSAQERAQIDAFVQFDGVPVIERDQRAAMRIADELENRVPTLILVNKVGAHFPIHDKFPDSHMRYSPILPRGQFGEITDTGDRDGFDGSRESWRRYRNSYRNTLEWSVGGFFEQVFARADLSNTVLLYTADHGQDLHADGRIGLGTHCGSDPVSAEGAVPLVALVGSAREDAPLVADHNGSHYRIMPTLLRLMGYERQAVASTYGRDLFDLASEPDTFNARFNARLGREPRWVSIGKDPLLNPVRQDQGSTRTVSR